MPIFHQVTGHGPTILLTHGFAATSHMFASTVAALADDHTVVVWDQLGYGRSDAPEDPDAVPTLVVGELDEAFLAGSRFMAENIPGAQLAVIAGAGHAPPVTHPVEFNAVLREFVARPDVRPPQAPRS